MTDPPADTKNSAAGDPGEESEEQRLNRNFNELLQELRVTQTGVQILTGFLLTLPFAARFTTLDTAQRYAYLAIFVGSVTATGLIVGPVALHRVLFRQGERPFIVAAANQMARAGLVLLALTIGGVVWLIFGMVVSRTLATVAMAVALAFFALLWGVLPMYARER